MFKKYLIYLSLSLAFVFSFYASTYANTEREWYENRYIHRYLAVPIQEIEDEWYFDSDVIEINLGYFEIAALSVRPVDNWFPLRYFRRLTGYQHVRRRHHIFPAYPGTRNFRTLENPDSYEIHPFYFQDMDLRPEYTLHPLEAEEMIMNAINYHRFELKTHGYTRLQSLSLAAIYHSIDQRDRGQHSQRAFDGGSHQNRMELWVLEPVRDYVRSSHVSQHRVTGAFTQEEATRIVDILMTRATRDWIMNSYYHYLGVGVGIQEDGTVRLTIHMATARSPYAVAYHVEHRHDRETLYGRHAARAYEWFMENQYGEVNPYGWIRE